MSYLGSNKSCRKYLSAKYGDELKRLNLTISSIIFLLFDLVFFGRPTSPFSFRLAQAAIVFVFLSSWFPAPPPFFFSRIPCSSWKAREI